MNIKFKRKYQMIYNNMMFDWEKKIFKIILRNRFSLF